MLPSPSHSVPRDISTIGTDPSIFIDELYQDHLSSTWQEFGLNDQAGRNVKLMTKARF